MLIDTPTGIVNSDCVVTIEQGADGVHVVRLDNGNSLTMRNIEPFERACGVIVPAQPGFDVITAILPSDDDEEGVIYTVETVIAFRIMATQSQHDGPMPITVSGEPSAFPGTIWTVRQPNGACFGPEGATDDLAAFKANCERAAERARRAA